MASHSAGEPGGTTDGSVTRDEYEAARQKLRSECEELRAEVKQVSCFQSSAHMVQVFRVWCALW